MPYIITTTQRVQGDSRSMETRTAVATLDEAREALRREAPNHGRAIGNFVRLERDLRALVESGGTIGPLPDGTVIEVRPFDA